MEKKKRNYQLLDWTKERKRFFSSKLSAKDYCQKYKININTFYKNINVKRKRQEYDKLYDKTVKQEIIKKIKTKAEKEADNWEIRILESQEANFKLLSFQRALLNKLTSDLKPKGNNKINYKELKSVIEMLEKIVDIGNKIMIDEHLKNEMNTEPYIKVDVQVDDKIDLNSIPEYIEAKKIIGE